MEAMLVKIEFRTGSYLSVNAGDMFQSADECGEAFARMLNGDDGKPGERFFKFTDFHGKRMIINRGNVNSVEIDFRKDGGKR